MLPRGGLLAALLSWAALASAQSTVQGKLQNTQKEPVSGAGVLVYQQGSEKLLAYTFSDEKGGFRLSFSIEADSVDLVVQDLGHQKRVERIANRSQSLELLLEIKVLELREVEINMQPVKIKNDTAVYNVEQFSSKADRSIGDILKKLPGVEVEENGLIKYKGRPIEKFYIENLDMLGQRYNIGSDNIPWEMVEKVEFYENHQAIKMLDSLGINGQNPALNLRLTEKARKQIAFNAELYAGATPILWEGQLTALKFFKNHQFINVLKSNNIGLNPLRELTEHKLDMNNVLFNRMPRQKEDLLRLVRVFPPPFQEQRFRFNESFMPSLNGVQRLPKGAQLRYHVNYLYENLQNENLSQSKIFTPTDTISINENKSNRQNLHLWQAEAEYEQNLAQRYTKNKTQVKAYFQQEEGLISGAGPTIRQDLRNPFFELANEFQSYRLGKGENITQWVSNTYLSSTPQSLRFGENLFNGFFNQGLPYNDFLQRAKQQQASTENFLIKINFWNKIQYRFQTGFRLRYQAFDSQGQLQQEALPPSQPDSLRNAYTWAEASAFAKLKAERNISRRTRLTFEGQYRPSYIHLQDQSEQQSQLYHFYQGNLMSQFTLRSLNLGLTAGLSRQADEQVLPYRNALSSTYRNSQSGDFFVPLQQSFNLSGNIYYNNLLNGWSINTALTYYQSSLNYLYNYSYLAALERLRLQAADNRRQNIIFNSTFNKYFYKLRSSFRLTASYNQIQGEQVQNDVASTFTFQNYSLQSKILVQKLSWLQPEWKVEGIASQSRFDLSGTANPTVYRLSSLLKLNVIVGDWVFSGSGEYYNAWIRDNQNPYFFIDASVHYRYQRYDFYLKGFNLSNQDAFETFSLQANTEIANTFRLRPINILAGLRVSF